MWKLTTSEKNYFLPCSNIWLSFGKIGSWSTTFLIIYMYQLFLIELPFNHVVKIFCIRFNAEKMSYFCICTVYPKYLNLNSTNWSKMWITDLRNSINIIYSHFTTCYICTNIMPFCVVTLLHKDYFGNVVNYWSVKYDE